MAPLTGRSGRRQPHSALAQNLEYETPATAISEAQPILVFPFPMLSRTVTMARAMVPTAPAMAGSAARLTSLSMGTASSTSAVVTATAMTASRQILSGHGICVDGCPGVVSHEEIPADRRHAIGKARRARVNRPGSRS
jgi:hypothetical protein